MAAGESWSGTKRPNYFSGRILGVDDLMTEQNYLLEKHRLHLRTLHGPGIVHGLQVSAGQAPTISIAPGLAIDPSGREIQLHEDLAFTVPPGTASPVYVILQYAERLVDPVPAADGEPTKASNIEEGCRVVLAGPPCDDGVAVGRLVNQQNTWRIDALFVPARSR